MRVGDGRGLCVDEHVALWKELLWLLLSGLVCGTVFEGRLHVCFITLFAVFCLQYEPGNSLTT